MLRGGRLFGRVVVLSAALGIYLLGTLIRQGEQLGNGFNVVHLELPHNAFVGDPLVVHHDDNAHG